MPLTPISLVHIYRVSRKNLSSREEFPLDRPMRLPYASGVPSHQGKAVQKVKTSCPACGSEAQVKLAALVLKVKGSTRWRPYKTQWFCLNCKDYHKQMSDERDDSK